MHDLGSLNEQQRSRFYHLIYGYFKTFEDLHYQYRQGTLDPEMWQSWHRLFSVYVLSAGGKQYWTERAPAFSETFQAYVESIESTPLKSIGELLDDAGCREGGAVRVR